MTWYYCVGVMCVLAVGCSGENGGSSENGRGSVGGSGLTAGGGATSSARGGATTTALGLGGNDNIGGRSGGGDNTAGATWANSGSSSVGGTANGSHPICVDPGASGVVNVPNAATPLRDDRDGQTYVTIQVGAQVWMAQNLNVGERVPGIPEWPGERDDSKIEKFCVDDLAENCATYGGLYTWAEAMGLSWQCAEQSCANQLGSPHRGICPVGWHIPTQAEWSTLAQGFAVLTGLTAMNTAFSDYWTELGNAMKSVTCFEQPRHRLCDIAPTITSGLWAV